MHPSTSPPIKDQYALITGAGSGIGRAVAHALARNGVHLYLVGRRADALRIVAAELHDAGIRVETISCDLAQDAAVESLVERCRESIRRLDMLIHCAGAISLADLAAVSPAELDTHYRVNVRAPVLLTQALLAQIKAARGQIAFVNSSLGVRTKERAGAYAASKHALKAVADTLRMEVNAEGVRVLSIFPGNTATPMQERLCREQGTPYAPEAMLQPDDVAAALVDALRLPRTAELTDLHIRPALKAPR